MRLRKIDWTSIERHYRIGVRTLTDLAEEYGCTPAAISRYAQRHGWERDLGPRVRDVARRKVGEAMVRAAASTPAVRDAVASKKRSTTDKDVSVPSTEQTVVRAAAVEIATQAAQILNEDIRVEIESEVQARIEIAHRRDVTRARTIASELLEEVRDGDTAAIRIATLKQAADAIRTLIDLERRVYGIDTRRPTEATLETLLQRIEE